MKKTNRSKRVITAVIAVLLFFASMPGRFFPAEASGPIDEGKAISIAISHAGLSEPDVTLTKIKYHRDRGKMIYKVEFAESGNKHSYKIDASSGEVVSESRSAGRGGAEPGDYIGMKKAVSIALAHSGVSESKIDEYETELKWERDRMIYEVEFEVGRTDYEYEIDARTGDIVKWEKDED